jgi:MoaA/NifB/PqqE/SkfB family radical SAM enzyme
VVFAARTGIFGSRLRIAGGVGASRLQFYSALTYECLRDCWWCFRPRRREQLNVDAHTRFMKGVARWSQETGVPAHASLTGGEPLLRVRHALDLAACASSLGIGLTVISSGRPDLNAADVKTLASLGVEFAVSLDSCDQAIHDSGRGPGSFKQATHLLAAASDAGARQKTVMILTEETAPTIDETIHFVRNTYGVRDIVLQTPIVDAAHQLARTAKTLSADETERIRRSHPDAHIRVYASGLDSLNLSPEGILYMQEPPHEVRILGHSGTVNETDLLHKVWRHHSAPSWPIVDPGAAGGA